MQHLGANPESEEWLRYLDEIDNIVSLKLKASVDSSYQFLIDNTGAYRRTFLIFTVRWTVHNLNIMYRAFPDPDALISPFMEVKMKLETVEDELAIVFEPSLEDLNVDKPYQGTFAEIIHLLIG